MKIDKYMKVDFHIHSAASKTKKGDIQITKDGIFSNIDVLLERMNDSEVNIFSFTDHNIFDYNLYKKVKEYIAQKDFRFIHILRIFPGIEFDLNVRNNPERIHATCIFKDDDEKVRKIPDIIAAEIKDKDLSSLRFNETQLTNIIRTINLDFILIVHQKSDIQNDEKNGDNDFSLLDENTKDELIYYDFFTMYESNQHTFRFRFEDYKKQKGMSANFITGTDCHTWAKYPDLIKNPGSFGFSYIKCDDTFDGLKIAFTGNGERRILSAIPSMKEQILDEFSIKINGNVEKIPLSNGINAVIGGNTSGKSLLISKAFGKLDARKKYLSFLEKWKIDFLDAGVASDKLEFIFQGQIRKAFEEDGASLVSKFQNRFKQIQYKDFVDKLDVAKDVLFSIAEMNTRREENSKKADCIISIPNYEDKTFYPQITPNPLKPANPSRVIVNKIEKIVFLISELIEVCENEDKPELRKTKDLFLAFLKHYEEKNASELFSQEIFETFIRGVSEYKNHVEKMGLTVSEKELLQYDEITQRYLKDVSEFIVLKFTPRKKIEDQVSSFQIDPVIENYNGLQFVTTPKVFLYDKKIILDILFSPFKLGSFDYLNPELIVNVTLEDFYEAIKNNSKEKINNLNFKQRYDTLFHEEINQNYCADTFKILDLGEEVQNTKSPGNNAVYFIRAQADFLNNKLIVIDQPEDDVAPEKIKDELIRSLDKMAITNQIIIVTHNPQLVVNLDVDNVICLDTSKDKFDVFYGPLYEKSRCNMLKIIADKLEGGKKLLKERWKRYEERDSSDKE